MQELEHTVAELVRLVERRYHGKYRGLVVDNADPERLGRLRLQVPSVLGDEVTTGWALPCVPYGGMAGQGLLAIPDVGAGVWVEFEEGDLEFPVWVGTFWSRPGGTSELPKANEAGGGEATVPSGATRKIFKSAGGHTIQIEDAEGEDMVLIHEAKNGHTVTLDAAGITITDGAGNFVKMTADSFTLHSGTAFTIDAPGQAVEIVAASIDFTKG
ncbi:phage baseplate assembly protein V [Thermomonospora amylolytica]|uniref:phage baseplate assembly protein V n=1 Tax=Thermomonospora amylolytica TaxID=1411117 RepID=UPI000E6CBC23|nr:phage baseplate assembly protein V [Thermomonospora amylolytica]